MKLIKERKNIANILRKLVSFSEASELLFFFMLIFIILVHTFACVWIFMGRLNILDGQPNWIEDGYDELADQSLYLTSFYFCITTITTVGYGDISGLSDLEKCFCIVLMLVGVISFSFATGSLTSILA